MRARIISSTETITGVEGRCRSSDRSSSWKICLKIKTSEKLKRVSRGREEEEKAEESRRWRILRSSAPKIEEMDSSLFGPEDRKTLLSSIFGLKIVSKNPSPCSKCPHIRRIPPIFEEPLSPPSSVRSPDRSSEPKIEHGGILRSLGRR